MAQWRSDFDLLIRGRPRAELRNLYPGPYNFFEIWAGLEDRGTE
jgi:hypothetical protein